MAEDIARRQKKLQARYMLGAPHARDEDVVAIRANNDREMTDIAKLKFRAGTFVLF